MDGLSSCDLAVIKYCIFAIVGFVSLALNGLLTAAIVTSSKMRSMKEYIIVAGLAFADFIEGTATFTGGVYRTFILTHDLHLETVPRSVCMAMPHVNMWNWADIAASGMLLAVSIDRLLAVALPFRYYTYTTTYAYRMVAFFYATGLLIAGLLWIYPLTHRFDRVTLYCGLDAVFNMKIFQMLKGAGAALSSASVLLYAVVATLLYYRLRRIADSTDKEAVDRQRKRQTRLTATLGISCACTVLLDSLCKVYGVYLYLIVENMYRPKDNIGMGLNWPQYTFLGNELNSMLNFAILTYRQATVRMAVKRTLFRIFRCKGETKEEQKARGKSSSTAATLSSTITSTGASRKETTLSTLCRRSTLSIWLSRGSTESE